MSNLYKSFSVVSKDKRVIDYNQAIQEKIEHIRHVAASKEVSADGFVDGLDAEVVEALVEEDPLAAITADGTENVSEGKTAQTADSGQEGKNGSDRLTAARETATSILSNAKQEAERILEAAKIQAEEMKAAAVESGVNEGRAQAQDELDREKESLEQQFAMRQEQLETQYQERLDRMEPELVDTITQLFVKVIHVIGEDNSQLVIDLINNAMRNMDMGNSFMIRVSPEDYPFVVNHQGKIYCAMSKDITIDIFEDSSLEKNQCKIESEFGVYDCSLDIQMDNLIKEIKLMSSLS